MANTLLYTIRNSRVVFNSLSKRNNFYAPIVVSLQNVRSLYSKSTLGLDGFLQHREKTNHQMGNILDKFREKMGEYAKEDSKNMIFTEDLKNMVHLAENNEDVDLVIKMIKKYNQQNKSLRFGNYIFGPVVMRMFYINNNPTQALECFKLPELTMFFDQLMSYQILLDLLYENKMYKEVLEAVDIIREKQIESAKYPRNIVVLALAACYKLNNKESLEYALKLWQELHQVGHFPMRRATTFCAGLALNQGRPEVALEVLASARNQNYTTVRNLKVAALCDIGRVEDVIPILKTVIGEDTPVGTTHTFNKDVLERARNAIEKSDNPELTVEFNKLEKLFEQQGNISDVTLEEQLCVEIQRPPQMNNRQGQQQRFPRRFNDRNSYESKAPRPGLADLV